MYIGCCTGAAERPPRGRCFSLQPLSGVIALPCYLVTISVGQAGKGCMSTFGGGSRPLEGAHPGAVEERVLAHAQSASALALLGRSGVFQAQALGLSLSVRVEVTWRLAMAD